MTYAFIIAYNRLKLVRDTAVWCADMGLRPIIVDNCSDYPPLLAWEDGCGFDVVRLARNLSSAAVWASGILQEMGVTGHYIVTDPDLDLSGVPADFLQVLETGLDRYPWAMKAGLSLELDDLPLNPLTQHVYQWEFQNWCHALDGDFYRAAVATTFCLCRTDRDSLDAVRAGRPYTARHLPWYYGAHIPEDERYYFAHLPETPGRGAYWSCLIHETLRDPDRL